MLVRLRHSVKNPGQVTGYAVALPGDTAKNREPVWYGGGKLADDLTWPKLCQRWADPARAADHGLTAAERNAWWEYAAHAAEQAAAHIRGLAGTTRPLPPMRPGPPRTPCTWLPPCWAAASWPRPPTPTTGPPAHPMAVFPADPGREPAAAGRADHVRVRLPDRRPHPHPGHPAHPAGRARRGRRRLRDSQQHAAQATAARAAAERLHDAARPAQPPPQARPLSRTAVGLAATSFPGPPVPPRPQQPGSGQHAADRALRPANGPGQQPRPRGPTR